MYQACTHCRENWHLSGGYWNKPVCEHGLVIYILVLKEKQGGLQEDTWEALTWWLGCSVARESLCEAAFSVSLPVVSPVHPECVMCSGGSWGSLCVHPCDLLPRGLPPASSMSVSPTHTAIPAWHIKLLCSWTSSNGVKQHVAFYVWLLCPA